MKTWRLLLAALLVAAASASAQEPVKLGVGAFGGITVPLVQDDQASGTVFGLRGRVKLMSFLVAEPNIAFGKYGAPDPIDGVDLGIDGSKITSFGIDATLGGLPGAAGFKPFLHVGIGSYKTKNDDTDYDESNVGYSGGLGFAIGASPQFDIEVRGKLTVIPLEDGGSKKSVGLLAGLTFNL